MKEKASSNYLEITIYDKCKETLKKFFKGKAILEDVEKYKNVIRTELKIKNGRLNIDKHNESMKNESIKKDLQTYYNSKKVQELYDDNVGKIFGAEDFYRIDEALQMIRKSKKLTKQMKSKLCKLLKLINKYGYTKARKEWLKEYSVKTFNSHLKKIESVGINVLTFDKVINGVNVNEKTISNFTLLKNGESEK